MSLFKKVKSKLSQSYQAAKVQRQEKQARQAALNKDVEKARFEGYRKGSIAKARKEGFRQAKTQSSGIAGKIGKASSILGNIGTRANAGLDFMNQDLFGTTPRPRNKKGKKGKKPKSTGILDLL